MKGKKGRIVKEVNKLRDEQEEDAKEMQRKWENGKGRDNQMFFFFLIL